MESHTRPFAVGRESAKANGIEPFDYLNQIFKELLVANEIHQLEKLLPYKTAQHYQLNSYNPSKNWPQSRLKTPISMNEYQDI